MSVQAKYKIRVTEKDKPAKISKEVKESLKGVVSGKAITRMKFEFIPCPVLNIERSFLECFTCSSFIRRFKGEVECAGGEAVIVS